MRAASAPRVVCGAEDLARLAARLGHELSDAYPDGVVLVGVSPGTIFFLADLGRTLSVPCAVDFLAVSDYATGAGRVRIVKDLDHDVMGRHVVVVADIVDTGLTSSYVLGELRARGPASLRLCALFDRRSRRIVPVPVDFCGAEVAEDLLVGYGLSVEGRYGNLPFVAAAEPSALARDPDAYVASLYGR
ncbi:MAG: phosphoribosyltransferase [Acidimicrobiales bacterium]